MIDPKDLENQLREALKECASLREENERLKKLLGLSSKELEPTPKPIVSEPSAVYTFSNQVSNDSPTSRLLCTMSENGEDLFEAI